MTQVHTGDDACVCELCSVEIPFDLPTELLNDCRRGNLVLFVGAGVSTESTTVYPRTFYADICESLGLDLATAPSFPDVMSLFVQQPNGRRHLVRRIRERITYVDSFPELRRRATRFHRELSTIHQIEQIITTNWDNYFERECGATPFVSAEDFAFWSVPGRKVLKLHGSVDSYGSVVATRDDYEACYDRLSAGVLGATLRLTLATRTVVFIGFSFSDDDFKRIHDALTDEMRGLRPQAYIVTPHRMEVERLNRFGLVQIVTDGTFFLRRLKAALVSHNEMVPDVAFDDLPETLERVRSLHDACTNIDLQRFPAAVYTLMYQDGLKHAIERILALQHTGYYSDFSNSRSAVLHYEEKRRASLRARLYLDAAYIDGYINGHVFFLQPTAERVDPPMFFLPGYGDWIGSLAALKRLLRDAPSLHRAASAKAKRFVGKRYGGKTGLIPHHSAFLPLMP